jgi:potassium-transporting ATPase KdpC subunit
MSMDTSVRSTMSTSSPWRASLALAALTLLLFGLGYSLIATGIGRLLFSDAATGSLVMREGVVIGSSLVAQPFVGDRYFHPRPSAAAHAPMAASGSNQARTNPDLRTRLDAARREVATREGISEEDVPSDLVTQSGSGLDPDISPAGARVQAGRVARARGLDTAVVERLIEAHVTPARLGLGAPRVNVLALNLALDGSDLQQGGQ